MSIDNLDIPVSVKCAASVIASIIIGTFVVAVHAKDIEASAKDAQRSSEEIKGSIVALASKADTNDKRIAVLEQALLQSLKDQDERKTAEKEIKRELAELQGKLAKMEGNSEAQTAAILRVLERLEKKVDR